jgi:hypothetical protein
MPLTKLAYRPGINKESTSYANEGSWYDCDKVRFRLGFPEKIGGWIRLSATTFLGSARDLHSFVALDGTGYIGVGTHLKYYIVEGGAYNDITPIRLITSAGDVTFSATDGSSLITVDDTDHGAIENDFVTFSGAVSLGGTITAPVLNQEYQIVTVLSANSYTIEAKDISGATVTANASDTGDGGASVVGAYQINTGLDTTVAGTGWGAGTWSRGTWGSGTSLLAVGATLRLWSADNFGEDLIINARDGGIYYWDKSTSSAPFVRAVTLDSLAGADAGTPTIAKQVLVSDNDRHVIVFGCDPVNNIGTQDPLLIRFSDQENITTWTPTATNTAGDLRIGSGTRIVCAVETRQQVLVFTDVSLHAMQYLGPPFTFGISQLSENTTIMGPMVAKAVDDLVFWMGIEEFYVYTGQVQKLPCTVRSYVFDDFNLTQAEKVFASLNSSFSEVTWFYPSASSNNIDRYVTYNYSEQVWTIGSLARTAWIDRGINAFPIAAGLDGYLYEHEVGNDDGSTMPVSPISAYIEASPIDIQDGDSYAFVRRLIPDMTFAGTDSGAGDVSVDMILKAQNFPGSNFSYSNSSSVTRSATVPVEQYTDQAHVRLRGRSIALRVESDTVGVRWRVGMPRIDIRPDGRRA